MRPLTRTAVLAALVLVTLVLVSATYLAAQPATQPAKANEPPGAAADLPEFVISDLRVQDFPAVTYLYTEQETTIAELGQVIPAMMAKLGEVIEGGSVQIRGAPIFVYDGATGEMNKPFKFQVGFPVAEGTKVDAADLQVRQLEPYHCATVLYSGSMANVGQAYQKVFTDIMAAGLKPKGGSREMHMYFENPESPNNIMQIQVAVEE
jgi:effector-binding domain-containing protein